MYKMMISKEQARTMIQALDLFSRIGIGQFDELLNHPTWQNALIQNKIKHSHRVVVNHLLDSIKRLVTGYPSNVSQGITIADEPNRVAYDLIQVMRHCIAKTRSTSEHPMLRLVDHQEPMQWSNQELANMEKIDDAT